MRRSDFGTQLVVCSFVLNGGPFLTQRFSVLPRRFLGDFLKSWVSQGLHRVSKLNEDVST